MQDENPTPLCPIMEMDRLEYAENACRATRVATESHRLEGDLVNEALTDFLAHQHYVMTRLREGLSQLNRANSYPMKL